MLTAKSTNVEGKSAIVIGITLEELSHLQNGETLPVDLTIHGIDLQVYIFGGMDDDDLLASMQPAMDEHTKVTDFRKE